MVAADRKEEDEPFVGEHSATAGPSVGPTPQRTERRVDRGSSPRRIASIRVGALGLSAWVVAVAVPLADGGVHSVADIVLVLLPMLALVLGVRFFARDRPEATSLLAIAFPALVATAMAGRADPAL